MDFAQNLTDDQIAVIGCATVLTVSGLLMYFSFYIGQWRRRNEIRQAVPARRPAPVEAAPRATEPADRRAA